MKIVDVIMESYEWKRENPIRNGMYVYDTGGIDLIKVSCPFNGSIRATQIIILDPNKLCFLINSPGCAFSLGIKGGIDDILSDGNPLFIKVLA